MCGKSTRTKCGKSCRARGKRQSIQEKQFERLLVVSAAWNRGRIDGILAGEFDGAFANQRSAVPHRSGKRVLEDVHDCDSTGGDSLFSGVFSRAYCEVVVDISGGRA